MHFGFHTIPHMNDGKVWDYLAREHPIASEIDAIGSDEQAIVVISVMAHFQSCPLWFYEARVQSIAEAAHRLTLRNKYATVIFKGGNTLHLTTLDRNDYYVLQNEDILRKIISSYPSFGFLDSWNMSKSQLQSDNNHPKDPHAINLIQQMLTHSCHRIG